MREINIIKLKASRPGYIRAGVRFSGKGREFPADQEAFDNWPAALGEPVRLTDEQLTTLKADPVITLREGTLEVAETVAEKKAAKQAATGQDVFDKLVSELERKPDTKLDSDWAKDTVARLKDGFANAKVKATHVKVSVQSEVTAEASAKIGGQILTSLIDYTDASENPPPGGDD